MPAYTRFNLATGEKAYSGNPAEAKNLNTDIGIKALYSMHAGDSDAGKRANPGRGMAMANHIGKVKPRIITGDDVPTGRNINSAVFAMAGDGVHIVVGLITIEDAFGDLSGTVRVW